MDNINISFAPDKSADSEKRLNDIENFISLLADRIKFCLADINDDVAAKSDGEEEKKLIYQVLSDGVGEFTNADKNCEIFNDYENNVASSYYAHAEGKETTASAPYSHAEGRETVAYELHSHAEGYKTVAGGQSSHAEGENCRATGSYSHAEGHNTVASGISSHASGWGTVAGDETFAIGRWNKTSEGLFVVGNGWNSSSDESDARRSDALVLDTMGNLHIARKLTADGGVDSGSSDGGGSSEYTLPVATADTLGGVIIGDNLLVSESGVIAADLSGCVKSDEIADWAKAGNKPAYTAEEIGLGNVDNTADADKPISSAMQTALDGKADVSHKHTISDITDMPASLPASGGNADTVDGKHASDFAVAGHTHTAADVGAAAKSHTHTKSQITDFPTLGTAAGKNIDYFAAAEHTHTAEEVGAATSADITAAVNAVEIGGRNLIPNTNNMLPYAKSATVTISIDNEWYSVATFAKSEALNWYGLHTKPNIKYSEIKNAQVTISFEYRSDEWIENAGEHQYPVVVLAVNNISESSNDRVRWYTIYGDFAKPTASWQKYTKTVTITDSLLSEGTATITDNSWFFVQIGNHSTNNLQLRKIKMEKGNKPTDWTPAPEDAERRITSLEARVAALEAAEDIARFDEAMNEYEEELNDDGQQSAEEI